jgi:DNA-binding NtrC family response regulator
MKKRILIVEEEQGVREALTHALDGKTCEIVWSQTAHEALHRSLHERFHLVVLDVNLSDMVPGKALYWFHELHPTLPVIVLTDRADQSQVTNGLDADAFLEKPLDGTRFRQTVEGFWLSRVRPTARDRIDSLSSTLEVLEPHLGSARKI